MTAIALERLSTVSVRNNQNGHTRDKRSLEASAIERERGDGTSVPYLSRNSGKLRPR